MTPRIPAVLGSQRSVHIRKITSAPRIVGMLMRLVLRWRGRVVMG